MIRQVVVFFLLTAGFALQAQEILYQKEISLKRGFGDKRESYPVTNHTDESVSFFLLDNRTVKGNLFDGALNLIDSLEAPRPDNSHAELLGSTYSDKTYNLFFSTKSYKSIKVLQFDYGRHKFAETMISLPLKKEMYVGSASYHGKFYMLTVVKFKSILKLYEFTGNAKSREQAYDFGKERFSNFSPYTLYSILLNNGFTSIDNEVPNAIDVVAKKNKAYFGNGMMMLTIDNDLTRTGLISIDLKSLNGNLKFYNQGYTDCRNNLSASANSYIYKNNLYQFIVCSDGMEFSISDLASGQTVNEYKVSKEDEIYFKNTPVLSQTGSNNTDEDGKALTKTKQFLRRVASSDAGISVYETNAGVQITLGGYKVVQNGPATSPMMMTPGFGMGMGMGMGMPYGMYSPMYYRYNPTYYGYNSYKYTRSVYFKSLLNKTSFQHQQGSIPKNAFDKIQQFTKEIDKEMIAETIFKKGPVCVLGYYHKPDQKFILRGFID
jgi:hypothetical protein